MDNIAQGAQQLIQLSERIKAELPPLALQMTQFHDTIFGDVVEIIGNLHDPLVVDTHVHVGHAEELIEDYVAAINNIRSRIRSTGYKLQRMQ